MPSSNTTKGLNLLIHTLKVAMIGVRDGSQRIVYCDGKRGFAGITISAEGRTWIKLRRLARMVGVELPDHKAPDAGRAPDQRHPDDELA